MQEATPIPSRKKKPVDRVRRPRPTAKKKPARSMKTVSSNPYANTPVQSNNAQLKAQNAVPNSGYGFSGTIPS